MPRGRLPKDPEKRQRRNADAPTITHVDADASPDDLRPIPEGDDWTPLALRWWDTWARSPQGAVAFVDTDWMRLEMLLLLVQLYSVEPSASKLAEIRASESLLGACVLDRIRCRINVARDDDDTAIGRPRVVRRRPDPRLRPVT
jgi:hypothetical protein